MSSITETPNPSAPQNAKKRYIYQWFCACLRYKLCVCRQLRRNVQGEGGEGHAAIERNVVVLNLNEMCACGIRPVAIVRRKKLKVKQKDDEGEGGTPPPTTTVSGSRDTRSTGGQTPPPPWSKSQRRKPVHSSHLSQCRMAKEIRRRAALDVAVV